MDILRWCIPTKEIGVGLNFIVIGDYSRSGGFLCYASIETMKPRYDNPMKKPPDNPEFARFTEAMRDIMKVSKVELQRRMDAVKRKPRYRASRASGASPKRAV